MMAFVRFFLLIVASFASLVWLHAGCSGSGRPNAYGYYRFDDNFENAVSVDGPVARPEGERRLLRLTGGWTSETGASTVEESESTLVFSADAADRLESPKGLQILGFTTDSIVLKMNVSGTDAVFLNWIPQGAGIEEHRILKIRVPNQNEMIQYNLQMTKVRSWRHRDIDQILFQVRSAARVEIESIELVDRRVPFSQATAGVIQYSIDDRLRPCLYNHCPATLRYRLRLPNRALFSAGLSVVEPDSPVTFQLVVETDGKVETVFTKQVDDPAHWDDVEVDLSGYAGREVDLSLISYNTGTGQVALWSNPAVFERYEAGGQATADRRLPNVVLYVIDCLRPDHMETYGYGRGTAPNLAAFAATGVTFNRCFAVDTWTKSSTTSFSTGVDQIYHDVGEFGDVPPEGLATFPELLRRAGYETCVLTENPHTPPETVPRAAYSYLEPVHLNVELGENPLKWWELPEVTRQKASAFFRRHQDRPFFLYVHTMELHDIRQGGPDSKEFSYEPPEPFRGIFTSPEGQTQMDLYDGAVSFADSNFKKMIDRLEQFGLLENTVVIVTADHGEDFGEHENHLTHHGKPYNTLTHVPLLIRWPGTLPAGREVNENVALLDVAPTILVLAGQAPFGQFQGQSLVPLIWGRNAASFNDRLIVSKWFGAVGAVKGDWKLFCTIKGEDARLYNLATDFGETTDVAGQHPALVESLKSELQAYVERQQALHDALAKPEIKPGVKVDPQTEQQLKALGYIE